MNGSEFYDRIKTQVKQQNTTIEALCETIGIPIGTYNSYRARGNPPKFSVIIAISEALGVSLDYLAYGHEKTASEEKEALKNETVEMLEIIKANIKRL